MNNKIKEILDDLDYCIVRKRGTITLNHKDCGLLLDYITNREEENQRLLKKSYSDDVRITKAIKLLKNKKEEYKNMTDYHQYYVEGYDKAIELTHSSHSGVMLETIKSATIKNCDDLLNILDGGSDEE